MNEDNQAYTSQQPPTSPEYGTPPPPKSLHSPARAALCAIVPGLGAVYNRQYQKAVVHFAVFAALIRLGDANAVFVIASIVFYLFMIIDSYRSAEVIRLRGSEAILQQQEDDEIQNLPLWGGSLVLIGLIFLLDNMRLISLHDILDFWPVLFIAIGAYLLYKSTQRNGALAGQRSGARAPAPSPPGDVPPSSEDS